jgi:putative tryptophan/tyrosine transport system substrate-binding protein
LGPEFADNQQQAVGYIEKILKGANPGDLPVESSDKPFLAVNSKAAKDLGITIPPQVQARANSTIE